ncbi:MAG TPA: hypothetical protein VFB60_26025 [Ktedonobacteraceae bacterium]|nr:hypothetical protein [Ktedonobacteraceae bacterium]
MQEVNEREKKDGMQAQSEDTASLILTSSDAIPANETGEQGEQPLMLQNKEGLSRRSLRRRKKRARMLAAGLFITRRREKTSNPSLEKEADLQAQENEEKTFAYFTQETLNLQMAQRLTLVEVCILNENFDLAHRLLLAWEAQTGNFQCRYCSLLLLLHLAQYEMMKKLLAPLSRLQKRQALLMLALLLSMEKSHAQTVQALFEEHTTWEQTIPGVYQQVDELLAKAARILPANNSTPIVNLRNIDFLAHTCQLWQLPELTETVLAIIPKKKRLVLQNLLDFQATEERLAHIQALEDGRQRTIGLLLLIFAGEDIQLRASIQQWLTTPLEAPIVAIPESLLALSEDASLRVLQQSLLSACLYSPYFAAMESTKGLLQEAPPVLITPQAMLASPPVAADELRAILEGEQITTEQVSRAQQLMQSLPEYEQMSITMQLGERLLQSQQWNKARSYFQKFVVPLYSPVVSHIVFELPESVWQRIEQLLKPIFEQEELKKTLEEFLLILMSIKQEDRALRLVASIASSEKQEKVVLQAKELFIKEQRWELALRVIEKMHNVIHRDRLMRLLSGRFALEQQWEWAEEAIEKIRDRRQKTRAIQKLGEELINAEEEQRLIHLIKQAWAKAETREEALELFLPIKGLLVKHEELIPELRSAFAWTEAFL